MKLVKRIGLTAVLGLALLGGSASSASADPGRHRGWNSPRHYAPGRGHRFDRDFDRPIIVRQYYDPVFIRHRPVIRYYNADPSWDFRFDSRGDFSIGYGW
ncbi:MAG: hypothetical protein V1798_08305 [Pseudomonadota bacterium]